MICKILIWILVVCFTLCSNCLHVFGQVTNEDKSKFIIGSWKECHSLKFDPHFNCEKNIIYVFNSDYTYSEIQNFPEDKINTTKYGKWGLTNKHLTLDLDDIENHKFPPFTDPIFWINNDLFYLKGREGKDGPIVYTYFQKIK